jgi:tetratricopeptide (TPR) repeat protein
LQKNIDITMKNKGLLGIWLVIALTIIGMGCKKKDAEAVAIAPTGNPAIDKLSVAIANNPNDPKLFFARAKAFYDNEGYDEAIQDLQRALRKDSTNVDYLHLLADVYLDYFKSYQALKTMEKVVRLYPERIPSLLKMSEFQLILKNSDASLKTLDQVLKIDPQNAEAYFMLGMNFKEKKDTARAINSFQTAVENDPDLVDAWINLGQLHAGLKNDIAARYFESALRIQPNNLTAIHAKAYFLQEKGDLKGALALFKKMAVIDPQNEVSYFNAGLLYLDLDSLQAAYRQFDLTLKVAPLHIRAFYFRGLAAEMLGNPKQAKADYTQALRLAPDYIKPKEGLARLDKK